jgi:hypothetical protein
MLPNWTKTEKKPHKVHAANAGLHDTVAVKAQKALQNPAALQGDPAARAKVEEANDKLKFEAKEKRNAFESEVKKDLKDTVSSSK